MTWFHAALLGILEGLTEFLPVSSTGHLILLSEWLGHNNDAAKTLDIVIQLGAVVAVIVAFRGKLLELGRGLLARDRASVQLAVALGLAFLPAAVVGLLLHDMIKEKLFGSGPVAGALIIGGVVMLIVEAVQRRRPDDRVDGLEHVTPRRALAIGLLQCFSLWPGASRSMTTIVGGQITGLSTKTAAEFSFLLAIPTLGAATLFDLAKNGRALLSPGFAPALIVGLLVSFVVALLVIEAFLRYLRRFGLAPFGVYRIALGALVIALSKPATAAHIDGAPRAAPRKADFTLSSALDEEPLPRTEGPTEPRLPSDRSHMPLNARDRRPRGLLHPSAPSPADHREAFAGGLHEGRRYDPDPAGQVGG